MATVDVIYRVPQVLVVRGICRTQHYADIKNRLWPAPVRIGKRLTGWPESEVAAMNAARIAGYSDDQLRALAHKLEIARKGEKL